MGAITSQITSLAIVYSTVYSDADQRKHQSSASLAFVWGIHRGPVNSPHKWPATRKMFPFDDVIMRFGNFRILSCTCSHVQLTNTITILYQIHPTSYSFRGDKCVRSWWRHQMETFSALLALYAGNSPVTGEFPAQRAVTWSFDIFFDLRLE